ncbi:DUF4062 domain-containing protein [Foetidibacter luteolus]|uniref:DUF4062 domain-containing protein n=1 Tax=Foetidibacter luteolus TaxID=2608880 RepID=UPI00129C0088|nr:DUF4062 domain-containing protein [Foetidibacter luteolus]
MADEMVVYLSSPYMEFKDIREKIIQQIQQRSYLYRITAMEFYRGADRKVLDKCLEDVDNCGFYILILGENYGSKVKDDTGIDTIKSFTYCEYERALWRKQQGHGIERIILMKNPAVCTDNGDDITRWKKEINNLQLQTIYFEQLEDIPKLVLESLDYNTAARLKKYLRKEDDISFETIKLCDRVPQSQEFDISVDEDPIQFFLLKGHDDDNLEYFIDRKEMEYDSGEENTWMNVDIIPDIPNTEENFERVEKYIKAGIFQKIKWKFTNPANVSVDGLLEFMHAHNLRYLSISWYIDSIYWQNKKLNEFIQKFYEKYDAVNALLKQSVADNSKPFANGKHIFFFGILRYTSNTFITEEEFNKHTEQLLWENNLPRFGKIKKDDIRRWLRENKIETANSVTDELVSLYLKDMEQGDCYFKKIEPGLRKIIELYNKSG